VKLVPPKNYFRFRANCFASRMAEIMLDGLAIPFPAMS
jgi:hypothetical protein